MTESLIMDKERHPELDIPEELRLLGEEISNLVPSDAYSPELVANLENGSRISLTYVKVGKDPSFVISKDTLPEEGSNRLLTTDLYRWSQLWPHDKELQQAICIDPNTTEKRKTRKGFDEMDIEAMIDLVLTAKEVLQVESNT